MALKIVYFYLPAIRRRVTSWLTLLLVTCAFTGCSEQADEHAEMLDESWFTVGTEETSAPDAPAAADQVSATLSVNLQQGDRFPLQKVVEKTLTQQTLNGPMLSEERIELFMAVTVEEIRDQHKKFGVNYTRVHYSSTMNGQTVNYRSDQPPYSIPDAALVYHGMVNNGFSFWVGPENKITEVVDFGNFMNRCLAQVPQQKQEAVAQALAKYSGHDGVANFVDDTIGLLPYNPDSPDGQQVVRLGGFWEKTRNFSDPVPMSLNNKYTLREVNDQYAKVDIIGQVTPAAAVANHDSQSVSIQIKKGGSAGSCTIDRKTGLPLESRVDHQLSMTVQLDGAQFDQEKRVVTSVRMFPEQDPSQLSRLAAGQQAPSTNEATAVQPASHRTIRLPQIQ